VELAEFNRVWIASKHWYEAYAAMASMQMSHDRATMKGLARSTVFSARAARQAHPGWRSWQEMYATIERKLGPALDRPSGRGAVLGSR